MGNEAPSGWLGKPVRLSSEVPPQPGCTACFGTYAQVLPEGNVKVGDQATIAA